MIFVRDKGQMCNNIIQFAHAYAWARENGVRAVSLRFAYKYRYFNISRTLWHNAATYLAVKFLAWVRLLPETDYYSFDLDYSGQEKAILSRFLPTVVSGWCVRHYDEVMAHLDELRGMFSLLPAKQKEVDRCFAGIQDKAGGGDRAYTIGLHIRRGDYARFMDGYYMLDDGQYIEAVRQTAALLPAGSRCAVVVCTNDRNLDEEAFRRALPQLAFHFSHGSEWLDLGLLAKCDLLLGVPSSYTLVAAMLGNARLHWLSRTDRIGSMGDFEGFATRFRQFDDCFRIDYTPTSNS